VLELQITPFYMERDFMLGVVTWQCLWRAMACWRFRRATTIVTHPVGQMPTFSLSGAGSR